MFVENGYSKKLLQTWLKNCKTKERNNCDAENYKVVSLPWIPGLSPKLRKIFKKSGYKTIFKSSHNLETILTKKNKVTLPKNSSQGVYKITCSCNNVYIGETGQQIKTRMEQHQKSIKNNDWELSGLSKHAHTCKDQINWDKTECIRTISNRFERKVREALEIQFHDSKRNGMNIDDGEYVTTKFWLPMMQYIKKYNQIQ